MKICEKLSRGSCFDAIDVLFAIETLGVSFRVTL